MTDLQTFTLAFLAIWGGLGAYLLWLHALARKQLGGGRGARR